MKKTTKIKLKRVGLICPSKSEAAVAVHPEHKWFYENHAKTLCYQNRRNQENFHEPYAYHTQYSDFYTYV